MRHNFFSTLIRGAKVLVALAVLGAIILGAVYGFSRWRYSSLISEPKTDVQALDPHRVARGAYLARVGDCIACHSVAGGKPFAGGLPLDTGFGLVLSSNITPDKETGIGTWNLRQFFLAMRNGIGDHGKRLYPGMPYNDYAKASDDDLISIKAYLDTLTPVHHDVDSNQMHFPFNIRALMIGWNILFLNDQPYAPDQSKSAEWNRGAYLVQGLGHCSTCHSPKNPLGGDKSNGFLQGAILQGWYAPKITGDAWEGVAEWSTGDIAQYLKTGANQHAIAVGPMAEAIANSTQYMNEADLSAIAIYLKSLPGQKAPSHTSEAMATPVMVHGQRLYSDVCATCHGANGKGVLTMGPALSGNIVVGSGPANNVLHMILAGGYSARTESYPKGFAMPGFGWKLSDDEVADLATFVRNAWGNSGSAITAAEVSAARAKLPK